MKNKKFNLNKFSGLLLIILIAAFTAPLSTATAGNGNQSNQEQQTLYTNSQSNQNSTVSITAPNISDNAKQYNRTDVTPKNQTEQVRAQEQTMFQFRNMTMTLNCTRNCTVIFTSDEEVTPKMFGLTVDPNQTMTLTMNLTKSPLNGAMVNERSLNFYLGIEPNASLELQAQIRLYINQTELSQSVNREINASRLTWMYWNQTRTQWETVESYMDQNGYLVCNTNHFSTWTVAEIEQSNEESTAQTTQDSVFPIQYIVVIGLAAAVGVTAVGLLAYKKHK